MPHVKQHNFTPKTTGNLSHHHIILTQFMKKLNVNGKSRYLPSYKTNTKINKVYLGTKRTESENQFRCFTIIKSSNQWKMYQSGNRLRVKIFCLFYDTENNLDQVITDVLAN